MAGQPYEFSYTYDLMGRLDRVMYPATPGWPRFETRNTYFPTSGETQRVQRTDTNASLWQAFELDASGRILDETAGQALESTYTYSPMTGMLSRIQAYSASTSLRVDNLIYRYQLDGNVQSRSNSVTGLHEAYTYDDLNRLEEWTAADAAGNATPNAWRVRYDYDNIGNMRARTMTEQIAGAESPPIARTVAAMLDRPH